MIHAPNNMTIKTCIARAEHGDNRFRGYALNGELVGAHSMASMAALAVGGPLLVGEERALLEDLAVAVTVADPRIWPLKAARIAGAYGSMFAAIAAGNLALERALMGMESCVTVARRLVEVRPLAATLDDVALAAHLAVAWPERRPPGFGVPARAEDERVVGITARVRARGADERPFFRLYERIARVSRARRGLEANLQLVFAALALDLGFAAETIGAMAWSTAQIALQANAVEAAREPAALLRRLPDAAIDYIGPAPRLSPRALAATASLPSDKPPQG